ncbi:MAG: permease [Pseudomonadota bacterium]|nr:permease [Pseudomonadota bacterium]
MGIFAVLIVVGLYYVKWMPYFEKIFFAKNNHTIGTSFLFGQSGVIPHASISSAFQYVFNYVKSIWQALILGLIAGSGIKAVIPDRLVIDKLQKPGLKNILLGSVFSLPCMMCTCCSTPVAIGMRQKRASVGSVVSWWLANPVLNPATLVLIGFVLGWKWLFFRLILGSLMVVSVAFMAEKWPPSKKYTARISLPYEDRSETGILAKWWHEFKTLALGLIPEYLVIVLLLGISRSWLFPVQSVHDGIFWIVMMALAGTIFVVPTAGEIPILQTMLSFGLGVGPAVALLLTLPAVSLPSLVMMRKVFSLRLRLLIAGSILLAGIIAGLIASVFLGFFT